MDFLIGDYVWISGDVSYNPLMVVTYDREPCLSGSMMVMMTSHHDHHEHVRLFPQQVDTRHLLFIDQRPGTTARRLCNRCRLSHRLTHITFVQEEINNNPSSLVK